MSTTVSALVTPTAGAPFERSTIQLRDVGPNDVQIDIAFAGICHSDIHQAREEWGKAIFPMVPGHEIAGIVTEVGDAVTKHKVGDRVGIGCFVDSCRECENCLAGEEQFCVKGNVATYNGRQYSGEDTYGGYSKQIVADENYVLSHSRGHLARRGRAPALRRHHHLLAAEALGRRPRQEGRRRRNGRARPHGRQDRSRPGRRGHRHQPDALEAGRRPASSAPTTTTPRATRRPSRDLRSSFDLIINTISADMDIDAYARTLRLNGTMVFVGLPENPQSFGAGSLIGGRRSLAGSNIGGIRETQEMLDFCAEHHIGAEIEVLDASDTTTIDEAYERVVASKVRYRFVIDTATI